MTLTDIADIADSPDTQHPAMTWRNTCSKEQRDRFLIEWDSRDISRSALCELFGISRQTGYKWVRRYRKERSVEEHSRRPKTNPHTTPARLVKLILSQRKQFPLWGPVLIRKRLQMHWPHYDWPAVSTIGAILKRHGMVKARRMRYRVPPRTQPFSPCREPNDVWCVDFKGQFATGDGRLCYPLTVDWVAGDAGGTGTQLAGGDRYFCRRWPAVVRTFP